MFYIMKAKKIDKNIYIYISKLKVGLSSSKKNMLFSWLKDL